MDGRQLQQLVDQADDAALLRAVDGLASSRDYAQLETLRERCMQAVEMGHQLWGVAMHIDYRLAWEGSAEFAARAVERGSSRFTLGPLTEVAASTHDWAALAPHLTNPAVRATVALERALRGEDLRDVADLAGFAGLPAATYAWEPSYALPRYRDREAKFPQPDVAVAHIALTEQPAAAPEPFDDEAGDALREVARTWWADSSGSAVSVGVDGSAADAINALRADREGPYGVMALQAADALALLQWAGASGGAYGTRAGGAAGRFSAWWAMATVAGLHWPERVDDAFAAELAEAAAQLRWYRWAGTETDTGWTLRLAIEDPTDHLAWAIEIVDQRDDEDPDGA